VLIGLGDTPQVFKRASKLLKQERPQKAWVLVGSSDCMYNRDIIMHTSYSSVYDVSVGHETQRHDIETFVIGR